MKKATLIILLIVTLVGFKSNRISKWNLDKNYAQLGFTINSLLMPDVKTYFKIFDGTITSSQDDFSDATVILSAKEKTLSIPFCSEYVHLNSSNIRTSRFSSFYFKSKTFIKVDDNANNYKVTGNLTMNGITKNIVLDASCRLGINKISKNIIADFTIGGNIKYADFATDTLKAKDIKITANAVFIKTGSREPVYFRNNFNFSFLTLLFSLNTVSSTF